MGFVLYRGGEGENIKVHKETDTMSRYREDVYADKGPQVLIILFAIHAHCAAFISSLSA